MLNASRHHRKNRQPPIVCDSQPVVLNASRHHRKNRAGSRQLPVSVDTGAQRLAASQEQSPDRSPRSTRCNRDVLNASRHHRNNRASMLGDASASRAQRLAASQEQSLRSCAASEFELRAQRLAASQEQSLVERTPETISAWSAQRLAASQEQSHSMLTVPQCDALVLNASRHHRNNRRREPACA